MTLRKSEPRKVLQVVHGFVPECRGGTEHYVLEAALALRAAGDDVHVFTGSLQSKDVPEVVPDDVEGIPIRRLHRTGAYVDSWHKSYDPRASRLFGEALREIRPDVVHIHHWIRLTRDLVAVTNAAGIPVVVTLHDVMASCPRAFRVRDEALCMRNLSVDSCLRCVPRPDWMSDGEAADEISAFASDMRSEIEGAQSVIVPSVSHRLILADKLQMPLRRFTVLPHGTLERHAPAWAVDAGEARASVLRLAHWGHFAPFKGLHILIEALRMLPERDRRRLSVRCLGAAADPAYDARIRELAAGLPVEFTGGFRPEDIGRRRFDVAVIPSIAPESYSFVLDEAFRLGVPAIVPDRGALAERLHGAGATFAPESASSLASRISEVLADPSRLDAWKASIPALTPMSEHATRLGEIYERAVAAGPRVVPWSRTTSSAARLAARLDIRTTDLVQARGELDGERIRWDDLRRAFDGASESVATLTAEVARKDDDLSRFEASIVEYREQLAAKDLVLAEFEASLAQHRAQAVTREAVIGDFEKSLAEHREQAQQRATVVAAFETSIGEYRRTLADKDAAIEAFVRSTHELHAHVADLLRSLQLHKERIEADEARIRELESASVAKDGVVAGFQESIGRFETELQRLREEAEARDRDHQAARTAWDSTISGYESSIGEHERALDAARRAAADASALAAEFEARWRDATRELRTAELEMVRVAADAADDRRARDEAVRRAAGLAVSLADEAREVTSWRARAFRAERSAADLRLECETASAAMDRLRGVEAELRRRVDDLDGGAATAADRVGEIERLLGVAEGEPDGDVGVRLAALRDHVAQRQRILDALRSSARPGSKGTSIQALVARLDALPHRLRVLMVIHDFLPYHAAGSEIYTYQLSRALQTRNDVHLVFCENRPDRPQYETRDGVFDGLPFTEIVHHDAFATFESTYVDSGMEMVFDSLLERIRPDVVHLQHTKFFGVGIIDRAKRRGIPVVCTLHEYMLVCARDGIMRRPDDERCLEPVPARCADCIEHRVMEAGLVARIGRAAGRAMTRFLPKGMKSIGVRVERRSARVGSGRASPERREAAIVERIRVIFDALRNVDFFFAPSVFLRDVFLRSKAVPVEKIVHWRYGQDLSRFGGGSKVPSELLRIGYLGTIAEYKGLNVLVDALNSLAAFPVEGRIHGALEIFPQYVAELRSRITNPRISLLGRYDNKDVANLLAEIDVLVVPSLWWENSPLTIHEAFMAEVPVVTSDEGGMAEMVQDGVDGFRFKMGDAADLARKLMRFVTDRGLCDRLRPLRSSIRDIREDAVSTEGHYRRLLESAARGRRR